MKLVQVKYEKEQKEEVEEEFDYYLDETEAVIVSVLIQLQKKEEGPMQKQEQQ